MNQKFEAYQANWLLVITVYPWIQWWYCWTWP